MVLVRVLLSVALAVVAGAFLLYLIKREPHYLRFIARVAKYTLLLLLAILVFYAVQRLSGAV